MHQLNVFAVLNVYRLSVLMIFPNTTKHNAEEMKLLLNPGLKPFLSQQTNGELLYRRNYKEH